VRFVLRYWTRRSSATIALPAAADPAQICDAARRLRAVAAEREWCVYGEAFLRYNSQSDVDVHLPVRFEGAPPPPPLLVGHIDHGPVVAAYEVPFRDAWRVATALSRYIESQAPLTGNVEYHFDPSVGRTEGIIVVPAAEHPGDKAAFISPVDAVTG
jgi:hypothetical protein